MTSIFSAATPTQMQAASVVSTRNAACDRARTFIILLVLIHHSVIPYTYYGHTDRQSFLGFDAIVLFVDSSLMSAMFFLSGLFVWPSLQRKGIGHFLRDRWLRLGLPFAVSALILMPVAYYAIDLRLNGSSFGTFWWKTVTVGPWPSGPAWFVWVLLAFDMLAAVVYRMLPRNVEAIDRRWLTRLKQPTFLFWTLLIASIIVYVPADLYFGVTRWFALGPLAIQANRVLLYLLYFFAGVGIGSLRRELGLLSGDSALARRWPVWLMAAVVTYGSIVALVVVKHELIADPGDPPLWWNFVYAVAFASFSASQTVNLIALLLHFDSDGWSILDPLRDSSYGIFLIHYVFLLWLQYALFGIALAPIPQLTAIIKAVIVFVVTLALSWAATAALRRIPGARHVL
jgi:GNAT superfamily N-acetyltransferase